MWPTVDEAWTQGLSGTFVKSVVTDGGRVRSCCRGICCVSSFASWVHPPPDSTLLWPEDGPIGSVTGPLAFWLPVGTAHETLQQVSGEEKGQVLPLLAPVP